MVISTIFAVNAAMHFFLYRRTVLLTLPIHEHLFVLRSKAILLRHWLGRIKEGSLTYPTRPTSVAGTTNMNNFSFYARKGILIPYWPGPISKGSLTYPPGQSAQRLTTWHAPCAYTVYTPRKVQLGRGGMLDHGTVCNMYVCT